MTGGLVQNTVVVGVGATLGATLLGGGVALGLLAAGRWLRTLVLGLSLITLALPPFLITNTWLHYLGQAGVWRDWIAADLNSPAGVAFILALWLWPVTTFAVSGAWLRLGPEHLEVDPELRGGRLVRFLLLPMARGRIVFAALITLVLATNNLTVPALLQINVYPARVWLSFSSTFWIGQDGTFDWLEAASLSWPLVVLPALVLLGVRRQAFPWPAMHAGASPRRIRKAIGPVLGLSVLLLVVSLAALSVGLPLWQIIGDRLTWQQLPTAVAAGRGAIVHSFGLASLVALACVGISMAGVSWRFGASSAAARRPRPAGWTLLLWIPFLIPGVLIGIVLIGLLNRPSAVWLYQSVGVLILGLGIRYLAVGWSITRHAADSVDPDLKDAALLEGATRWQLVRHVFWPQAAPQAAAAGAIIFVLCLWEVETLVLIIPPGGETVALRVFNLLHYGHTAHVNALCLVLLGMAVLPLLGWAGFLGARAWLTARRAVPCLVGWGGLGGLLPLLAGCAPELPPDQARVENPLFERVEIIATRGLAPGQVNKPRSVAVDHDDNLFVLDFTGRVQKFSSSGEFLLFWQMPETERGNPKGLGVNRDGHLIVVEPHYARVNLFTSRGERLGQWGVQGTNEGHLSFPRAVAVSSAREWFISEFGVVDRVQKFLFQPAAPASLQFEAAYGSAGAAPGQFNRAEGLCMDSRDQLVIADAVNHRVQVLDRDGTFLRAFGRAGRGPGELSYPYDVCVDEAGRHYVCEFGNSRIQVFDAEGKPICILGGPGAAPGFFNNPWGIALDSKGNLYVADSRNHRVQKFVRRSEMGDGRSEMGDRRWEIGDGRSEIGNRSWGIGVRKSGIVNRNS